MENSVEVKPCINIESKSLEFTIYLYLCYGEHEAPSTCNITVYLSLWYYNLNQHLPSGGGGLRSMK